MIIFARILAVLMLGFAPLWAIYGFLESIAIPGGEFVYIGQSFWIVFAATVLWLFASGVDAVTRLAGDAERVRRRDVLQSRHADEGRTGSAAAGMARERRAKPPARPQFIPGGV